MVIKDPNSLFKDDGDYSRYIYVYIDEPELGCLERWLTKYSDVKINNLEVKAHVDQKGNLDSKVILDASVPNKYFNHVFDSPECC